MAASTPLLPALRLGEIVLATHRYDAMKQWYRLVLDQEPASEHAPQRASPTADGPVRMCFFRLHAAHPYQDVVAIFEIAGAVGGRCDGGHGLHHMQLRSACVADLQERYRRLHAMQLMPHWAMDHGPSTSLYYRDPDSNLVELAAGNFSTQEETDACLQSDEFRRNPAGVPFRPELWLLAD